MRNRLRAAGIVTAALSMLSMPALPVEPAAAVPATGRPLFRLADPRLNELSGLALGRRNPELLYAQNDSGDRARFFALDARTGAVRAECAVPGVQNHDWEDLATGPSSDGVPSVWLADVGDNDRQRSSVQLYRVDEPLITGAGCATTAAQVWQLRYPDGAHDAESLIQDPVRHRSYLVTKDLLGASELFAVPPEPSTTVQTLTRVATVQFRLTGTPGGPNPVGQLTATGASLSSDGSLLAIRTYTDAYLWRVSDGDVAAAVRRPPVVVPLPAQPQGEGIAVASQDLLLDSEQVPSTVYAVPIPAAALVDSASSTPSPAVSSTDRASGAPSDPGPSSSPSASPSQGSVAKDGKAFAGAVVLMLVLAGAAAIGRRRRR